MKNFLAVVGAFTILTWVLGFASEQYNAVYKAARRNTLLNQATPFDVLTRSLNHVAVPPNCPLSGRVLATEGVSDESLLRIKQIEVTNRSSADLIFYKLEWEFYPVENRPVKESTELPSDTDSIVRAGESFSFETPNIGATSEYGFKSASIRISAATFSDGSTCGSPDMPWIQQGAVGGGGS